MQKYSVHLVQTCHSPLCLQLLNQRFLKAAKRPGRSSLRIHAGPCLCCLVSQTSACKVSQTTLKVCLFLPLINYGQVVHVFVFYFCELFLVQNTLSLNNFHPAKETSSSRGSHLLCPCTWQQTWSATASTGNAAASSCGVSVTCHITDTAGNGCSLSGVWRTWSNFSFLMYQTQGTF